jgi:SAM-dependent methyltransferase
MLRSVALNGVRGAIGHSYNRLLRSLKNHGARGTFERAFLKAPVAPPPIQIPSRPHPFDLLHGTDTGGCISTWNLAAVSLSAIYSSGYIGIPPSTLRPALAALPIKHEDFSFVDLGCGKGRALLVAAQFPFRHLFGVEITDELCDIARANVALNPDWENRISIVNEDATTYIYPDGPFVLYLYYPFLIPVLRRVLTNLVRQLRRSRRPAYLLQADLCANGTDCKKIYTGDPRYQELIRSFPFIQLSDTVYPISAEEVAVEPSGCIANSYALCSVDVTR